ALVIVIHAVARRTFHGEDCEDHGIGKPELTTENATSGAVQHGGTLLHRSDVVVIVIRPAEAGSQHQRIESLEECTRCVGGADERPRQWPGGVQTEIARALTGGHLPRAPEEDDRQECRRDRQPSEASDGPASW